jgi:predicted PurR-regulated permease PerM
MSKPRHPTALDAAARVSWQLLLVAAAVVAAVVALAELRLVVLPVVAALFLATVLSRPVSLLRDHGWPRALAALAVMAASLLVFSLLAALLAPSVVDELDELSTGVADGVEQIGDWLLEGPLGVSAEAVEDAADGATGQLRENSALIVSGVLGGALLAAEVVIGALLTLVLLFFFLKDGDRLWASFLASLPEPLRADLDRVGDQGWTALSGYLRGISVVAVFDAVFIGIALWLIGVPLVLPLAVLTFFAAYFPIVGAVTAGVVAALVALVSDGIVAAAAVAIAVVVVQQVESNLLHPVVVGRAVELHPVVILVSVTGGGVLGGIIGAFLAVPLAAVIARVLRSRRDSASLLPGATAKAG